MAAKYLKEDASGGYQLEDGSGVLLLEPATYKTIVSARSNLRWYLPLDETSGTTVTDAVIADTGTFPNGLTLNDATDLPAGMGGGAPRFDIASQQYITLGDHANRDLGDTFTLVAWFKRVNTDNHSPFMDKGTTGGAAYEFGIRDSGNGRVLYLAQAGTAVIWHGATDNSDTASWHQAVVTKSGSTRHLYIDHVLDDSGSDADATLVDNAQSLDIGRYRSGQWFDGWLCHLQAYSVAWAQADVTQDYTDGTTAAATTIDATFAAAVTSSDAWVRSGTWVRALTGATTSSDTWTRAGTFVRSLTAAVGSSAAWTRSGTFVRSLAAAVGSSDAWTRGGTFARPLTGAVTSSDAWTRSGTFIRSLSGAVTSSDGWVGSKSFLRTMTEAVSSADAWTRSGTFARTLTGAVTSADAWTRAGTFIRALASAVTSGDAWTRSGTWSRTLAGSVTSSDAWTRSGTFIRTLASAVTHADDWVGSASSVILRTMTEAVTSSDAWTWSGSFARTLTESVTSSDIWTASKATARAWSEAVTSSDAWERSGTFIRSLSEAVGHADVWVGQLIIGAVGGLAPTARAFAARVAGFASSLRPGGSADNDKPGGSADHPKPGD